LSQCFLLVDCCVLIDFTTLDESLLVLASRYIGDIYVASPVLAEVRHLDTSRAASLGIKVYEPTLEMLLQAAPRNSRLSLEDRLCIAIAQANGWTCVSNDRQLRAGCKAVGVTVMWGLELLIRLVDARALSPASARTLGQKLADNNRWLTPAVLARFDERIGAKR
jgi:predicted nucleic acid-binding protein